MSKSFTPHYVRIRNHIVSRINSGELKKDQRLPSERELADQFNVSRITIVGALRELAESGIIRKIRGSGSYINCSSVDTDESEEMFGAFFTTPKVIISHGMLICPPKTFFIMKTLAALFRLENPEIKVEVKMLNPEGYNGQDDPYLRLIGAGTPPTTGDFFFHSDYSSLNALYPLEHMPGYDNLVERLHPGMTLPTVDASGYFHTHAIALKLSTRSCAVNVDFLRSAGITELPEQLTYDILDDWMPRLGSYAKKHPGTYGACFSIPDAWHNVVGNFPFLWGDATGLGTDSDSFLKMLSGARCIEGLRRLRQWYKTSFPAGMNQRAQFLMGNIGINLSDVISTWLVEKNLNLGLNARYYQMPTPPGLDSAVTVLGNFSVGIFRGGVKSEDELDAAWKWLKFLFQKRTQYQLCMDYEIPAVKDVKSSIMNLPEEYRNAMTLQCNAHPQFDFKNIRAALSIFGKELRPCILGEIEPEICVEHSLRHIPGILAL